MLNNIKKERLEFNSSNDTCVGYLYYTQEKKSPCIIMASGFGGTQDTPSIIETATQFALAGINVFTFDYRNLGESSGNIRQFVDIVGQQEDFIMAVSFIKSNKYVNDKFIGLWGTSLGGGHVVSVAAKLPEISVVIAQIPYNGVPKKSGRSFMNTIRLLRIILKDKKREKKGLPPIYVPAVGQKGELAVIASDQASKQIAGLTSKTWKNEVTPRSLFDMMKYKPSNVGNKIKAQVLICYGKHDKETQVVEIQELIQSIPNVKSNIYPYSHWDFYVPEIRKKIIEDQIAFVKNIWIEV